MDKEKFFSLSKKSGMSVIEALAVIGIMVVVSSITFFALSRMNGSHLVSKSVFSAVSYLDQARSKTLSANDSSQYGVHFTSSSITLFKGSSYSPSDPNNITTNFDPRVSITSISLNGGGSDVVFKRLTGTTDQSGTLTFSLNGDDPDSKTITIFATGINQSN